MKSIRKKDGARMSASLIAGPAIIAENTPSPDSIRRIQVTGMEAVKDKRPHKIAERTRDYLQPAMNGLEIIGIPVVSGQLPDDIVPNCDRVGRMDARSEIYKLYGKRTMRAWKRTRSR
jgi:hypothetical protein